MEEEKLGVDSVLAVVTTRLVHSLLNVSQSDPDL